MRRSVLELPLSAEPIFPVPPRSQPRPVAEKRAGQEFGRLKQQYFAWRCPRDEAAGVDPSEFQDHELNRISRKPREQRLVSTEQLLQDAADAVGYAASRNAVSPSESLRPTKARQTVSASLGPASP